MSWSSKETTTCKTLLNALRAFLGNSERYCKEVYAQIGYDCVEIVFTKGRPYGPWNSPELKFMDSLEFICKDCGYELKESDYKMSKARPKA